MLLILRASHRSCFGSAGPDSSVIPEQRAAAIFRSARLYVSWALMALVAVSSARPAEAAPFAYVVNEISDSVSVIDTATNKVVASVALPVGSFSLGVAVTPDGKHAYVTNSNPGTVSMVDTATNNVVADVALPRGM